MKIFGKKKEKLAFKKQLEDIIGLRGGMDVQELTINPLTNLMKSNDPINMTTFNKLKAMESKINEIIEYINTKESLK